MSDIIRITSDLSHEIEVFSLKEPQLLHYYEPERGIFIAESPLVIGRALDADYQPLSLLVDESELKAPDLDIMSRCGDVPVYTAEPELLTQIIGFKLTRGTLCAMRRKELPPAETLCKNARRIAVLENVLNPTNVGAIIRSAAALNIDAVLLTNGCSDPLYRRSARVSMGTVFQIPWTYVGDDYISVLHKLGFKTAAMALCEDSVNIDDNNLMSEPKLAVILGSEGYGLCDETIKSSDYTVMIPMTHGVDSLNVAAASAVAFWQLGR